jgi:hypothetical protein
MHLCRVFAALLPASQRLEPLLLPCVPHVATAVIYAYLQEAAALMSYTLGVDMVLTGHSLGRNKLDHLLKSGEETQRHNNRADETAVLQMPCSCLLRESTKAVSLVVLEVVWSANGVGDY